MSSKLQERISLFSCSTLPYLHWVLGGPSSHWLCDFILVRSTGISGIWCLIAGGVRFTSLQHPQVKRAMNLLNKPQTALWGPNGSFLVLVLGSFPALDTSVRCYWKHLYCLEGQSPTAPFHVDGPQHWEIGGLSFPL